MVRPIAFPTLVDALRHWATVEPDRLAFRFLTGDTGQDITYRELDLRAQQLATALQHAGAAGQVVYLTAAPGIDFVAGFFGCLYAGAITVPTFPPGSEAATLRFESLIQAARPVAVVAPGRMPSSLAATLSKLVPGVPLISTDGLAGSEHAWRRPDIDSETVAFLQFTSGSTSLPKGVILSHGNLLADIGLCDAGYGRGQNEVGVSWLPPYHDMGLIGSILFPAVLGFPVMLMSPFAMLTRPLRWLRAISRYRGTISGAPNFAYELCVSRATPQRLEGIDLSSWRIAINGAEVVRAETLERFAETFAPYGFRREAFRPSYGLAETAVYVSNGGPPTVRSFDREALEHGRCIDAVNGNPAHSLVACARGVPEGETILIVDPDRHERCAEGHVGEVWVSGPQVARGYWGLEEETACVFGARLRDGEGPFLRTGDLGTFRGDELFIVGRLKELIIVRGRNIFPTDVESCVERAHPAVRPNCVAAFAVDRDGGEELIVVAEVDRRKAPELDEVIQAVRGAVTKTCDVAPSAVVLIEPYALEKTTSGKIMRTACRAAFLGGKLEVAAAYAESVARRAPPSAGNLASARTPSQALDAARTWLVDRLAEQLNRSPEEIKLDMSCAAQGVDSLAAAELATAAEDQLGISLSMVVFRDNTTVDGVAAMIATAQRDRAPVRWPDASREIAIVSAPEPIALPPPRSPRALLPFSMWARAFYGLRGHGVENAPSGAAIYCPNHESHLDIFFVASLLPPEIGSQLVCFAKREHFDSPVMRRFAQLARAIPLDREGDVRASLRIGSEALRAGRPILIHPEGTRTRTGEILPFRPGAAMLAVQHQVPLVPVRIHGAFQVYPATRRLPRLLDWAHMQRLPIEVSFGRPIVPPPIDFSPGDPRSRATIDEISAELRAAVEAL